MNFKEFDNLIHSGAKGIVLDSDVIFGGDGEFKYSNTIELDVDDLIINGAGHRIDARCSQQIFEVTGNNIKIKNLTIEGGSSQLDGGAIYNDGGSLIIEDCTFMENHSNGFNSNGGAIYNLAGSLNIFRISFLKKLGGMGCGNNKRRREC